jgi:V/A-type H+-transporting ATPase subunit E
VVRESNSALTVSSGVQELIDRLREDGVAEGRAQAEKIVADAESRARWIVQQAEQEADILRDKARADAEHTRKSLREALAVAVRDAILSLKSTLTARFADEVRQAVGAEMQQREMLQRLILEVAGRVREQITDSEPVTVLLPRDAVGLEELRRDPKALGQSPLTELAGFISKDMLREGVSFVEAEDERPGIRLSLRDDGIQMQLTDQAVTDLLLAHLQPRFRALVEGIVG